MNIGLKNAWNKHFETGCAVSRGVIEKEAAKEIIIRHFSSLTMDNAMKFGSIHPKEDEFFWDDADYIADFAVKNHLKLRGHTIIWHNQNPPWLFVNGGEPRSKTKLLKRLEDHITAVTQRYKNIVNTWDVINEAIETDTGDENEMRLTEWYKICGKEAYEFAFKLMKQLCPNAKLYYNDYNNESGAKLEATLRFLSTMLDKGIPIDGVGLQGHWYYNYPDEKTLRNAIERYTTLGLEIQLTEVDISLYKWDEARNKDEFFLSAPEDRIIEQAKRYMEIFSVAADYPSVKNITTWGISDNHSWLNDFPVKNRKNWPLLFDDNWQEKPVVSELIKAGDRK